MGVRKLDPKLRSAHKYREQPLPLLPAAVHAHTRYTDKPGPGKEHHPRGHTALQHGVWEAGDYCVFEMTLQKHH